MPINVDIVDVGKMSFQSITLFAFVVAHAAFLICTTAESETSSTTAKLTDFEEKELLHYVLSLLANSFFLCLLN